MKDLKMLVEHKPEQTDAHRALLLVGTTEETAAIAQILHAHHVPTLACHTPSELATEIEIGGAVVVVSEACLSADTDEVILHSLADQRVHDVPLIVLTTGENGDGLMARLSRVSGELHCTSSAMTNEFAARVQAYVESKQQANAAR